ncbi:MAG: coiled-coil domain-containing protein [Mucilaginibacter sp.]
MATITFDTHQFVKELKEAGFSEEQAEAITNLQKTTINTTLEQARHEHNLENLVTNKDLDARIRETELKIDLVRSELKRDIAETKADLIRWVVGVGILQMTLIAGLILKITHAI